MSTSRLSLAELPWLPRASADLRARLRAIEDDADLDWGPRLQRLAGEYLGLNQALTLAKAHDRLRARAVSPSLTDFRLGLVSTASTDFLKPFLVASGLRHGLSIQVIAADFGQLVQEALDPQSQINQAKPHAVLLAVDHRGLPLRRVGASDWPLFATDVALEQLTLVRDGFRRNSGASCVVQTLPNAPALLFGSLDAATAGTLRAAIAAINAHLVRDVPERGDVLLDVDWLAQSIGLEQWYDDRHWYLARMACSQKALPLYADFAARTLAAVRGKARKCLILDLDNTLWGGVIGDDGLDGIALNPGDAQGEAFRAIQQTALDLRRRGVVLAVCSKNDEAIARQPFRSHSGMLLKEDDIAVFVANWDDKATNIERIARSLELGIDAMVLLDDNPVERAQVRAALPQVAVPELGDDPTDYPRLLLAAGYFEAVSFTREDLTRAHEYRSNADRERMLAGSRNLDDFLRSLEMRIQFASFNAAGRKRIAQLINKTNQFNVTTRRYTEQQVEAMERAADRYTLQVSVSDKFGDNGMISVVICDVSATRWSVDTWLMSCRVLNRRIEEAILNRIVADARAAGASQLVGSYIRTERNEIVRELYSRLGFAPGATAGEWTLDLDQYQPFDIVAAQSREETVKPAAVG
jgi:FkbH-like protein